MGILHFSLFICVPIKSRIDVDDTKSGGINVEVAHDREGQD